MKSTACFNPNILLDFRELFEINRSLIKSGIIEKSGLEEDFKRHKRELKKKGI